MEVQTEPSLLESLSGTIKNIYRIANESSLVDFKQLAYQQVINHIQTDSGIWVTRSDMNSHEYIATKLADDTYLYNQPEAFMDNYQRVMTSGTEQDWVFVQLVKNQGKVIDLFDVMPEEEWLKTPSYTDHCAKFGLEQIISCMSPATENTITHLISLYRADRAKPFSEKDKQTYQLLFPHLVESFRINILSSFKRPSTKLNCTRAVCDRFGFIIEAESAFYSMAENIISQGKIDLDFDSAQTHSQLFVDKDLHINIDFIQGAFYIEVIQQTQLKLTKREKQIAALVSQGLPDKSISEQLEISPSTVNNHLNNIFKKVRVKNRTALIAQLSKQGALEC
ncbi:helix-turn-helix transcriptional regulator [Vibrio sp. JC009]|uniref:helix-turn-helix domain-containing protein n=1 Tax=Vibrio sp. JC009 TaxID=2912314 RepID=UPI0023B041A5|nr:helix-turn-helix transcriptional regulator [Vibrio sp. JC009]WED22902.1 helix-turn-helix transcriptional regulator [Vibrio sp. JC009]